MRIKRNVLAAVVVVLVFAAAVFVKTGIDSVYAADREPVTAHPMAKVYQAEDAVLSGGTRKAADHTGYTGTGFVGGYDNNGSGAVTFNVDAAEDAEYYIDFRYSAGDVGGWAKNRTMGLLVNGSSSELVFNGTDASWNTWEEKIIRTRLNAGNNVITVKNITSDNNDDCINLDKISVWKYSDNPVTDAIAVSSDSYTLSIGYTQEIVAYLVNSNGVWESEADDLNIISDAPDIVSTADGKITGLKAGTANVTVKYNNFSAEINVTVVANPLLSADCGNITRKVDNSMFGYILTPNYDIPDSRMTLLGPVLNRETIPAQNFQAIGDMDGSYYQYEGSILMRQLEAYTRAKNAGLKYYMLLGHNPSWATASGGPTDSTENKNFKTEEQLKNFKQYIKDVLQYMKDNGAKPDFADLTNEYWTGTEETFKVCWEALREVYPDAIPAVGPGAVGYSGIPDFYIPYVSENQMTLEGPSWHEFWTSNTYASYSQLKEWHDNIADLQKQYPQANGKYIIWEENNAGSVSPADWARSMSNVVRTGVDYNIKGCLEGNNWNGMSDLLTTNVKAENNSARRGTWWVYYAFAQMSGQYVEVTTENADEDFTGAVSVDKDNIKIIAAKNDCSGSMDIRLDNVKLSDSDFTINTYKITDSENAGLSYQGDITSYSYENGTLGFEINNVGADEAWFIDIKDSKANPGFFVPLTPDDGQAAVNTPELTWTESQGADSYTVTVSENKDMSNPVINESGITGQSYKVQTPLKNDVRYYWTVTAENSNGKTTFISDTEYSFLVKDNENVPGQFGPYMPSVNAVNEDVNTELKWSTAYNADSYHVIVSENADFSDAVVDVRGIKTVRGTGQFGNNSQGYYRFDNELKYNTRYYWIVYAENSDGERPMNGPLHSFTTKAEGNEPVSFALTYPENNASDISARTELIWEASANAFFYSLTVSENPDMSDPVIERPYMIYNKYTVEPNILLPGRTYYWTVTAYTKDRKYSTETSDGVQAFTVKNTPCSPLLYAEMPESNSVTLKFAPSEGADKYCILYGRKPGEYTHVIKDVTDTEYTVGNLLNGYKYYFAVVAVNDYGISEIWNERSEMPESYDGSIDADTDGTLPLIDLSELSNEYNKYYVPPVVNPPADTSDKGVDKLTGDAAGVQKISKPGRVTIKKAKVKGKKLILTWKKQKKADGYIIQISKKKKFNKIKKKITIKKAAKSSYTIKLAKGKYYIRICAYKKDGTKKVCGKWSKKLKKQIK